MTLVTRSVTIQVRVMPVIKHASEQVLWRIGLNMSEAVELFLRRVIVDERIPFEVVALETSRMQVATEAGMKMVLAPDLNVLETTQRGYRRKKEFKKFFGGRTPSQIQRQKKSKKRGN
jgi:addiction module RelB/DinJ family antitoxin